MEARLGVECGLAEMAAFAKCGQSTLSALFRQELGMSLGDYRNQIRRDYARRAVIWGARPKQIASDLGFSSLSAYLNWKKTQPL